MLEQAAASLKLTQLALGDWDQLLQQPARLLPALLELRGLNFTKQSRYTDAAQAASKLLKLENATNGQLYNAACVLSLCAASIEAGHGEELSAEQKKTRQQHIADALDALRRAADAGYDNFAQMHRDPDLAVLRDLPEFRSRFSKGGQPESCSGISK